MKITEKMIKTFENEKKQAEEQSLKTIERLEGTKERFESMKLTIDVENEQLK